MNPEQFGRSKRLTCRNWNVFYAMRQHQSQSNEKSLVQFDYEKAVSNYLGTQSTFNLSEIYPLYKLAFTRYCNALLYGIWRENGRSEGGWMVCNSNAIVLQPCGRCRWEGQYNDNWFVHKSLQVKDYLVKANLQVSPWRPPPPPYTAHEKQTKNKTSIWKIIQTSCLLIFFFRRRTSWSLARLARSMHTPSCILKNLYIRLLLFFFFMQRTPWSLALQKGPRLLSYTNVYIWHRVLLFLLDEEHHGLLLYAKGPFIPLPIIIINGYSYVLTPYHAAIRTLKIKFDLPILLFFCRRRTQLSRVKG